MKNAKGYSSKASAIRGLKRAGLQVENCVVNEITKDVWVYSEKLVVVEQIQEKPLSVKPTKKLPVVKATIKNGIRDRIRSGSVGFECWELFRDYFEASGELPDTAFTEKVAKDNGWKLITVKTELYDWKRFNDLLPKKENKIAKSAGTN